MNDGIEKLQECAYGMNQMQCDDVLVLAAQIEREHEEELQALEAELDRRLMPPGMEWPRFEDGMQITWDDAPEDIAAVCIALDGSCYSLHYDMPDDERMCIYEVSERVKRHEPEVLGADGLPIKVGDTVYDGTGNRHVVVEVDTDRALVEFDGEPKRGWRASFITHTPPDTQERIDDDATMPPRRYYAEKIGHDVDLKDDEDVFTAVALSLLRRQRELDARTMGGRDTFKHNRKCVWSVDDDGSWDTGCGNKAIWDDDGKHPAFCPWCGGTVVDQ